MGVSLQVAVAGAPGANTEQLVTSLQNELAAAGMQGFEIHLASGLLHALIQNRVLGDCSHYAVALEHHQVFDLTLLSSAMDDGCASTAGRLADPALSGQFDAELRQTLDTWGTTYTVLVGSMRQRCATALQALDHLKSRLRGNTSRHEATPWHWNCESCSDADREQQLFTQLLKKPSVGP